MDWFQFFAFGQEVIARSHAVSQRAANVARLQAYVCWLCVVGDYIQFNAVLDQRLGSDYYLIKPARRVQYALDYCYATVVKARLFNSQNRVAFFGALK